MMGNKVKTLVIDSQYLPSIAYFVNILKYDQVQVDVFEFYEKQSYRNRCRILSSQGPLDLSIPIMKSSPQGLMRDTKIDNRQKWARQHWRSISAAYGKAPFYEFYVDFFSTIYERNFVYLIDLNQELMTICHKILGVEEKLVYTSKYVEKESKETLVDLRSCIHPRRREDILRRFGAVSYFQVFGKSFVANLSILDLIFCEGPNAKSILQRQIKSLEDLE